MGVGNTRDELINTYKTYPNFEVNQYKNPEDPSKTEAYFTLDDIDAGTYLTFKMENNVVIEVNIVINEGC